MKPKRKNGNPMLTVAAVLLCLVLISCHFMAGLYARYISRSIADAAARVASFVIETDLDHVALGSTEPPNLQLGGTDEIQSVLLPFYVSSGSEVAVGYSVTVDFKTALPDYLKLTLESATKEQTLSADGTKSQFAFSDFGTLSEGSTETQKEDLTLTISVDDLTKISDEVLIPTAELTVKVYQVD